MSYTFRPAVREQVGLFIGLAGGTGSGKTWTAMELATGISGDKPFAVIDTENKRASHYADYFKFEVLDLTAPFNSHKYEDAVKAAFDKGYPAIVVDSVSHEHDGEGGFLDMQMEDLEERVKRYMGKYPNAKEYEVMQKLTPSSWQKPKKERKRMMQTMLSCSSTVPIIFCFRAEQKAFESKDGKLVARKIPEWVPICAKTMPFEMTVFFMLDSENPGVGKPIKLQEQHKTLFSTGKVINKESGRLIAEWASGGIKQEPPTSPIDNTPIPEPESDISNKPNEVTGLVQGLDIKKGNTKGKDWTRYAIKIDGIPYVTFSDSDAKLAKDAHNIDAELTIVFEQTAKGRNIKNIQLAEG